MQQATRRLSEGSRRGLVERLMGNNKGASRALRGNGSREGEFFCARGVAAVRAAFSDRSSNTSQLQCPFQTESRTPGGAVHVHVTHDSIHAVLADGRHRFPHRSHKSPPSKILTGEQRPNPALISDGQGIHWRGDVDTLISSQARCGAHGSSRFISRSLGKRGAPERARVTAMTRRSRLRTESNAA
jgi:hypothetical protein